MKADLEAGTVACLAVRGPAAAARLAGFGPELRGAAQGWPGPRRRLGRCRPGGVDRLRGRGRAQRSGGGGLGGGGSSAGRPVSLRGGPHRGRRAGHGPRAHRQDDPARGRQPRRAHRELHEGLLHRSGAVARLQARGANVARRLRGVVVDPGGECSQDATLFAGERPLGRLTSVAWSPRFGAAVALAYVRRDVVIPAGATLTPGEARPRFGKSLCKSDIQKPWQRSHSRFAQRCATR